MLMRSYRTNVISITSRRDELASLEDLIKAPMVHLPLPDAPILPANHGAGRTTGHVGITTRTGTTASAERSLTSWFGAASGPPRRALPANPTR